MRDSHRFSSTKRNIYFFSSFFIPLFVWIFLFAYTHSPLSYFQPSASTMLQNTRKKRNPRAQRTQCDMRRKQIPHTIELQRKTNLIELEIIITIFKRCWCVYICLSCWQFCANSFYLSIGSFSAHSDLYLCWWRIHLTVALASFGQSLDDPNNFGVEWVESAEKKIQQIVYTKKNFSWVKR